MAPRGLQRSSDDRMLFGVAGGLADCFDIDPVLVRVGFVIAGLRSGIGVITYVIPAILTPRAPVRSTPGKRLAKTLQGSPTKRWKWDDAGRPARPATAKTGPFS